MKAQSAIEYLTTYGWMLVVVAIVGGALYPLIGSRCIQGATGFQSGPITVEDSVFTEGNNLSLELANKKPREIKIQRIVADVDGRERSYSISKNISAGQQDVASLSAFEKSESCKEIDINIVYSIGSLHDLQASGTLTGQFSFNDQRLPQPLDAVNVNY